MVSLMSLWLPILLSAVVVFVASALIHMVLGYHAADYRAVPNEDAARDAIRKLAIPPGDYLMPAPTSRNAMKDPAFVRKLEEGPRMFVTVLPPGPPTMGGQLAQWFVYCVIVSFFAAYITSRAVAAGTSYLHVFRFIGASAFLAYGMAHWQAAIWYRKAVGTTIRNTIDALIYACLTAGVFGWLWPR